MTLRLEFKRQDCWVGVFWRHELILQTRRAGYWIGQGRPVYDQDWRFDVWVCLLPMLPLHFTRRYTRVWVGADLEEPGEEGR